MTEEKKITGAVSVIGAATMLSRILGYIRDAVIASYFGAGLAADAFFVAFRVSNLLRRLVGEGALTSSFVPVFTDVLSERTKEEASRFVSAFFMIFFVVLVVLALLGIIFSESLVTLMAPGFDEVEGKFALTVKLTKLMFPFMVFIGLMAVAMGVLNTLKHFAAPAISPVFFNISIIISTLVLAPLLKEPVYALAGGVLIGGVLQFVIQLPFLAKFSMAPRPIFSLSDPAIKKVFLLMAPAILSVGVYQLNIFVTMRFASNLGEGSVSYLYYGSRLMELPLGVFAVAISTAVLPSLSEFAAKKDHESFSNSMSFALRASNFVSIPATVGLIVLSLPIIEVLFQRGEFGATAASETSFALYFYALGIVPIAASRILVSVYFSIKDTVTPMWAAVAAFVVNVVMCLVLMGPLRHGGLALATTVAAVLNFACLAFILRRKVGSFGASEILGSAAKSFVASIVMGVTVYGVISYVGWEGFGILTKVVVLFATILGGAGVYVAICSVLKVPEITLLRQVFVEKVNKKKV